jgi:hypothetical protein
MKRIPLILLALLCVVTAIAQETTGGVRGTVTDPSGAAVPNARVEISGSALVRPLAVNTDTFGNYIFPALPPGEYTITVTASGFRQVKQAGINLQVGRLLTVDFRLEVGAVTESVTITAAAALVDVSQSTSQANVSRSFFEWLPKGRTFDSLIELAPGARREVKQGGYQVDGASGAENVYTIDGVEVTNLQTGDLPRNSRVPVEFLSELVVRSSGFEAQYGGATGGVVATVIRSGSNEFHGQASLYFEHDSMNAAGRPMLRLDPLDDNRASYFHVNCKQLDPANGCGTKDGYRLLNPGFALGGPFVKDKLWFFTSYYPAMWRWERPVYFLRERIQNTYTKKDRQDWFTGKLDWAPTDNVRTYFSYVYSPYKANGLLPTQQGTDTASTPWADRGNRTPGFTTASRVDYTITPKLLVSVWGGYNYRNYKDYGIPRGTPRYRFMASNINMVAPDGTPLPVPANLQGPTGNFTPDNRQTVRDIQTRWNLYADASYLLSARGQHNLKWGYQINRLHNDALADTWPDGYILLYWNRTRAGITRPGTMRGRYGYYIDRFFATTGDVASDNMSLYIQDGWNVHPRLRLNLGLRTEREYLPSFRVAQNIPSRAIEFGFGDKIAPRLGFAWDVFGNTRFKVYGSFGLFYDLMKYEMPRGSFGGDVWIDVVYPLDDPDFFKIKPMSPKVGPNAWETVDWRIPANDPNDNTIDPNLKPMRERVYDFGIEHALTDTLVLNVRYNHKKLDRTIEDVGVLTPQGEKYYIANPGFGLTADPKTFGPGIPTTPKAKRIYDAMEIRLDKRFSRGLTFQVSYTLSRLYGNYGGLASSDENGRMSPNVNRYFDLPWMNYDAKGRLVEGRLATDRPHALKFFGTYALKSKLGETRFSPVFFVMSGTPLTTEVNVISTTPMYVNGRGDYGRTPVYSNTDFGITHDFRLGNLPERYRVRIGFEVFNLFNQSTVTDRWMGYVHPNDGQIQFEHEADVFKGFDYKALMKEQNLRVDPRYGWASAFQGPRTARLGIHFFF